MEYSDNSKKLQALPFQVIELPTGVLIKRGCAVLKVSGEGASSAVHTILSALTTRPSTYEEIADRFAEPERNMVRQLIQKLVAKHLIVNGNESAVSINGKEGSLEIFYWQFGEKTAQITNRLNTTSIAILGVNCVSRQLASSLIESGFQTIEVIDYPLLRNIRLFDEKGELQGSQWPLDKTPQNFNEWSGHSHTETFDCLVATSDFGGQFLFCEWNNFCVENQKPFLPVMLQDGVGQVGPFVIPGETACYQCLLARQDSHRRDRDSSKFIDEASFEGQTVVGFHPSMASILGDIAAVELTKFYGGRLPGWNVGTLIEVNLLSSRMTPRKVLKVPRCHVCSPLLVKASMNPSQSFLSYASSTQ